jgi:hypothetical protein
MLGNGGSALVALFQANRDGQLLFWLGIRAAQKGAGSKKRTVVGTQLLRSSSVF